MALGFFHDIPNAAVFVCIVIVVTITTMFLSCFRKKKGDKKKKDGKKNAPTSPPSAPVASATVDTKPSVTVGNHSKDGDAVDHINGSEEPKSCQDSNDALGDFSAVRETEILRSYRKPPPPQNRARQSRAPRALKSSAENLDIFSEHNNDVFEFNEDATIKPSGTAGNKPPQQEKDSDETDAVNNEIEENGRVKMRGSSQGRSSMLEDINNTLASIHLEASSVPAEVTASVEEKAQEVKEDLTTNIATTLNAQVEEEVKTVNEEMKEEVASDLKSAVVESQQLEKAAVNANASVISTSIDEVKDTKEDEDIEGEIEKQENEIGEKAGGLKTALEEKSTEIVNEIKSILVNGSETVKDDVGEVDVEQITCEVKETVESKVKETVESKVKETFGGIMSDSSPKDDTPQPNNHVDEVITEKSLNELEESPKKEVKIPPKVSPKPSPKIKPKSIFQNSPLTETTSASLNTEPSPPETNGEKTNDDEKVVEKVDSPPATPTSPTSPTSKGQSRIPMSKKTSGIPKLAFNSSKSSSASPLASPDSAAKRLDQAEEIANKVQKEVDKAEAGNDLKTNDDAPATPTSEQPESEMNSSTSSPFNEDNRDSKRKLMKLRYSGRKKSSESKSDESGSDRGSRAGSEAKSDDGKKTADDNEVDKNSRIPVRGGSKPRSSPPKTLGNQ